jgi:Ca2+-binding EF-hand superfamily protein
MERPVGGVSRDLQKEFKDLDRDGDGFLSRAEVEQNSSLKAKFEAADKNGDGKLDLSEFQVLEAEASPDRSLGSASPVEKGAAGGASR